jgi:hypothetical protein
MTAVHNSMMQLCRDWLSLAPANATENAFLEKTKEEQIMGKRSQISEFEAYLRDSAHRVKKSNAEIERTGTEAALNRCRELARQLQAELSDKRGDHFIDVMSLADFQVSLERAAFVLEQKVQHPLLKDREDKA